MNRGKFTVPPSLSDALDFHRQDAAAQLRVAVPGQIITYDADKRTASIMVGYNRVYNDGKVVPITAPLVDVPVLTMQGGGAHVAFPILPGDECLVVFADINIDAWHKSGGQQTPLDQRRHDISDGFAIVGPNSLANALETALGPTEAGLATAASKVAIDAATELITIDNGAQNLKAIINDTITQVMNVNTGIAAESATIPTAASAAAAANVQLALILTRLAALLY